MKVNIEIDCTPEEFKELMIPSDRQAEFAAKAYQAMVEAMGQAMAQQFQQFQKGFTPERK
ncbi:hypothetical protein [Rhodobaculum claviforme]|uniref:Uncharacterized protein n=1 Tax=Rhodobaculum claviforme TaxID=1549854 RepID=A0A934TNA7_9RHOB|nr:hypothetical protein [Rhodobaculum claviforme]MBK5928731.1 hypothetical protein [Rhodobaculum claviforme]